MSNWRSVEPGMQDSTVQLGGGLTMSQLQIVSIAQRAALFDGYRYPLSQVFPVVSAVLLKESIGHKA